ncbi:hypothetical protein [Acidaminococcus sp. CAG:542]|uniref:hypothetical protein n=1 Tax=Acidaminococcus sp. CAG:542 TaxID=1262687 RepID=UPI00258F79EB|nr:hypothetical protein [Acidaminococcus sp. CAG:542]
MELMVGYDLCHGKQPGQQEQHTTAAGLKSHETGPQSQKLLTEGEGMAGIDGGAEKKQNQIGCHKGVGEIQSQRVHFCYQRIDFRIPIGLKGVGHGLGSIGVAEPACHNGSKQ